MSVIIKESIDSVLILTLNNPSSHNAMDVELIREFREIIRKEKFIGNLRALVITGAGNKAFSSGADIKQINEKGIRDLFQENLSDLCNDIERLPIPTIAAINGYAVGGGLELALSCDFRVASENSLLGLKEVAIGLIPSAGATRRLTQLIGPARTKELIFKAKLINSKKAFSLGIVDVITKEENLITEVKKYIEEFKDNAPLAVSLAKLNVNAALFLGSEILEKISQSYLLGTEDKTEGVSAFLEKRYANFKGR